MAGLTACAISGMKFASTLLMLTTLSSLCGCATVVPPPPPSDPSAMYLTSYGKHSSILLRDPRGHLTEYAAAKLRAETELLALSARGPVAAVILRPSIII